MLDSQNQIAKDTISMKKTNEFFLPNARIADYTVEQWEIKLDKNSTKITLFHKRKKNLSKTRPRRNLSTLNNPN